MTDLSTLTNEQLEAELVKRKKVKEIAAALEQHPLKCKTVTRVEVDSSDLEQFIYRVFGVHYESACAEEMSNDTQRTYNVQGIVGEYDQKYTVPEVEEFLYQNGIKSPALSGLLNYIADKNYIAKGSYIVKWSW
jgi:hypothetical protein